jgi:anti-anti-sigma regulatory factor
MPTDKESAAQSGVTTLQGNVWTSSRKSLRRQGEGDCIIDMEGVSFIDIAGADQLKDLASGAHHDGIDVRLAKVRPAVFEFIARSSVLDTIGPDHIHGSVAEELLAHSRGDLRSEPLTD